MEGEHAIQSAGPVIGDGEKERTGCVFDASCGAALRKAEVEAGRDRGVDADIVVAVARAVVGAHLEPVDADAILNMASRDRGREQYVQVQRRCSPDRENGKAQRHAAHVRRQNHAVPARRSRRQGRAVGHGVVECERADIRERAEVGDRQRIAAVDAFLAGQRPIFINCEIGIEIVRRLGPPIVIVIILVVIVRRGGSQPARTAVRIQPPRHVDRPRLIDLDVADPARIVAGQVAVGVDQ